MNSTNNLSARATYDKAKQMLFDAMLSAFTENPSKYADPVAACWNWVNSRKLSQNEVRLEVNLDAVNNIFTFGVTPTQSNSSNVVFKTENRLALQDSLIASEYGIALGLATGDNDTAYEQKTYPNTQVFNAVGLVAALNGTFYSNGSFQLRCNQDVIMPYRGLYNHLYRPETQQTDALGAASPQDQVRGAEDGFVTMEPNILLIGSKNYEPQIVLKSALAVAVANLRCVLTFRGVLAQNSTIVN